MPNVLILMSDQHASGASGAYGNTFCHTPNIDRLAASGTRFENAYCNSPICVPSRAAMATGRYVHDTGNYDNASPYTGSESASWGHRVTAAGLPLVTIGKLHYRNSADDTGFPDQRLPLHVRGGVGDIYHCLRDKQLPTTRLRDAVLATEAGDSDYTQQDRSVADEAARWLRDEAPRDQQWVAKVSLVTPHYPFTVPQEFLGLYPNTVFPSPLRASPHEWDTHPAVDFYRRSCGLDEPLTPAETQRSLHHYYALVSFMDAQLGVVLDALERSGQAEDTVIIYLSDHGELMGTDGTWFKGTMREDSIRVPAILAGSGVPVGTCRTNVSLVDVFPTVIDVLGLPTHPDDVDLPGRSLLQIAQEDDHDRTVFSEYHSANSASGSFMIRSGRWKYEYHVGFPERLFDLEEDPEEWCDLRDDAEFTPTLDSCRKELQAICDPTAVDARIRSAQRRRLDENGGVSKVRSLPRMTHSPIESP